MVQLSPSPASAHEAREVVVEQLASMGRPELVDDVAAVVTELVVNAVIHARTTIGLRVQPDGDGVRIEVSDGSPVIPRWTPAAMSATSGRGLILVDRMTSAWGVQPHGGGKTIWAVVDRPTDWVEETSFEELLARWTDEEDAVGATASRGDRVRVVLTVDVAQMLDSRAHTEDLVRELQLVTLGDATGSGPAVVQLAQQLSRANDDFRGGRHQILTQTLGAAQRGERDVRLDLSLDRDDGAAARRWLAALDAADALAGHGALLLPPFPPELVRFRQAYIADIVRGLEVG